MSALTFDKCSICLVKLKDPVITVHPQVQGHTFHEKCIDRWLKTNQNCPLCRRDVEILPINGIMTYVRRLVDRNKVIKLSMLFTLRALNRREAQYALNLAAIKGNHFMCKMILDKSQDANLRNGEAFILAARNNKLLAMGEIYRGADITKNQVGEAMAEAARRGYIHVLEYLCYFDRCEKTRGKALIAAVSNKKAASVEFLLRQKIVSSEDRQEALELAQENGFSKITHLFECFS